jgi:hypothetical protein
MVFKKGESKITAFHRISMKPCPRGLFAYNLREVSMLRNTQIPTLNKKEYQITERARRNIKRIFARLHFSVSQNVS